MFFKLKIQSVLNFVNYFQTAFFLDKVMNNYFQKLISYYRIFNKTSLKNKTNKKFLKLNMFYCTNGMKHVIFSHITESK